jgi:hypothetical protein
MLRLLPIPCSSLGALCGHLLQYGKTPIGEMERLLTMHGLQTRHNARHVAVRWAHDEQAVASAAQRAATGATSQAVAAQCARVAARAAIDLQTQPNVTAQAVAPIQKAVEAKQLATELVTRLPALVATAPAPAAAQTVAAQIAAAADKAAAEAATAFAVATQQVAVARRTVDNVALPSINRQQAAKALHVAEAAANAAQQAAMVATTQQLTLQQAQTAAKAKAAQVVAAAMIERADYLRRAAENIASCAVGTVREADALTLVAPSLPSGAWEKLEYSCDLFKSLWPPSVQAAATTVGLRITLVGVTDAINRVTGELLEIKTRKNRLFRAIPIYERVQLHGYMYLAGVEHIWHAQVFDTTHIVERVTWDADFWQQQVLVPLCAVLQQQQCEEHRTATAAAVSKQMEADAGEDLK